ncbi:S8 family serine peptidase [Flavobacteriaceae bacterium]|nr:S8 family serine peptidase [Flavobacteriaceae bacterium]
MKIKLLFALLFFTAITSAQNIKDKNKIQKNYDLEKIDQLIEGLKEKENEKQKKIDAFLKKNPEVKKNYSSKGKNHEIYDIVNNRPIYISSDNNKSAIATKTTTLYPGGALGLNLEGENMTIGVWEVGGYPLLDHVEFLDDSGDSRISTPDTSSPNPTLSFHATHVNGTIGAKGENFSARGMAPKSTILAYSNSGDTSETVEAHIDYNMLISNHSYGVYILDENNEQQLDDWVMGSYTSSAANWDEIHFNTPYYLRVASAGNSGTTNYENGLAPGLDKLTYDKNSKNSLIVASANITFNASGRQIIGANISYFSSQGPTDDGRIKPDITGRGQAVFSTSNNSTNTYANSQGTSMSSPNVAGSLLLLQEHYNNINNEFMLSATLRGLACHTATDDAENEYVNAIPYPGPDPFWGWGFLDVEFAAQTITDALSGGAIIEENTLNNGDTYSFTVNVTESEKLMATISWTDRPGPVQSGTLNSTQPVLVNDLDLRITDNLNNEYLPWKLDLTNLPYATKGDNVVDNIERVEVEVPSGQYTITVSHKGNLAGDVSSQDYSLIVTGANMSLSTTENNLSNLMIWPNPANNVINFQYPSTTDKKASVTLFDLRGRIVYEDTINTENVIVKGQIETSNFARGVYILNLKQGTSIMNQKVVLK